jgi:hypothetical protein
VSNELSVVVDEHAQIKPRDRGYLSSSDVVARMTRILEIQQAVMKEGVHYGKIPGTPKPTLYKPGAEKLLVAFQIAASPCHIDDLSTCDEAKFRVRVQAVSQVSGVVLGEAMGECSSNEEKYRWRKPVCDEEWDETPEDLRRAKWMKGRDGAKPYRIKQIRTAPADVSNTILQMASKRALIPVTRLVLACSDIFDQDLEDMPPELRESLVEQDVKPAAPKEPQRREPPAPQATSEGGADAAPRPNGDLISEPQRKRLYAIGKAAGWEDDAMRDFMKKRYGIERSSDVPRSKYDDIVSALGAGPGSDQ